MTRDQLRQVLSFYNDLGITDLYRAASPEAAQPTTPAEVGQPVLPAALEDTLLPLAPFGDTLEKIQQDIGPDCRRCRLCEQRSRIVFGVGNPQARLVFVGEGPGADEDAQGI